MFDEIKKEEWKKSLAIPYKYRYTICNSATISGLDMRHQTETQKFGQDDIITFVLDLCKQEIRYCVNEGEMMVITNSVQRDKDIQYKFYVSIWYTNDAVSILHSSIKKGTPLNLMPNIFGQFIIYDK